jgi:hypothetical protein
MTCTSKFKASVDTHQNAEVQFRGVLDVLMGQRMGQRTARPFEVLVVDAT